MPKTPKDKPKVPPDDSEPENDGNWGEDQETRGYYYDDAHGYEVYRPEDDEKEECD